MEIMDLLDGMDDIYTQEFHIIDLEDLTQALEKCEVSCLECRKVLSKIESPQLLLLRRQTRSKSIHYLLHSQLPVQAGYYNSVVRQNLDGLRNDFAEGFNTMIVVLQPLLERNDWNYESSHL